MIRGLLGVVVVVGFFDQLFGFQVSKYLVCVVRCMLWFSGFVIVRIIRLGWLGGWLLLVLRLCWCWMVV
jgi:hypothetical protein